ncbi:hypothetical protein CC85DRAFT_34657 [Cutaneotrichosporon oleaginosum]|uniref:Uncharacterized protein n=1 Tax=Cutaneotrichosporon oleaginosum TaxID=879819 RepID=A0A0J1ASS7_9TREE|nr:uncharacterized protein CC85DRAFT_34657 [Cutaneotrichosporon oleaginosum]KLT38384.1 hypothetical protein CC85DRAFT_34657 [Cutaneotrichosporon oleaginosum]TXT07806.1 hypothetical protein COLE_04730 [Cutaneotrichosporon oleaginosum]
MTRARDLAMPMPPIDLRDIDGGPSTPSPFEIKSLAYGRPRALPTSVSNGSVASDCSVGTEASASTAASDEPQTPASALAGLALSSCEVTPLSTPLISPASATVTGKRHRDEWTMDEVQLLENVLARPPPDLHFPPGSMPPPEVIDGLTSAILETLGRDEDKPKTSIAIDIDCSSIDVWPHSWDATRHKLAALALADTRLGAELANRKLTRQERLARPGLKRVGSMDYLDDEDGGMPSERIGRVLRLSTSLQNSARGVPDRTASLTVPAPAAARAASLGALSRSEEPLSIPRTSSSLSVSSGASVSRRPSLLARGRSFTAEDLEGEEGDSIVFGRRLTAPPDELAPTTPLPAAENTPAVAVLSPSPPEEPAPKRASLGRSKSYGPSPRDVQARRDSFLAPPMPPPPRVLALDESSAPSPAALGEGLATAFEWTAPSRTPSGWESDSDRECPRTRRKMKGTLAMTALNAATRERSSSLSSGSSRSRSASLSTSDGASTPPLVISMMVDEAALVRGGGLRSPFEEKTVELA